MVAHSPALVQAAFAVLGAVRTDQRDSFNAAMHAFCQTLSIINAEMEGMWARSRHQDYQKFRTFIMGTHSQPMFPKGVIYEGVSEDPMFFRGESGANDSIIPTADNLLELYSRMPENPLTAILRDFRGYRPVGHQLFLTHLQQRAAELGVRRFALEDSVSALRYLESLDQVRDFRWRHWNFTKEYILKHSKHPVATGGSPIVTWLPNQLGAVLQAIDETKASIKPQDLAAPDRASLEEIVQRAETQHRALQKEVEELRKAYPGQDFAA